MRPTNQHPTTDRHSGLIARSLAYAEAHLDEPLTAEILADHAALSRHHFHRVFRAYIGCSVANYVTWLRLRRAFALLVSGTESVSEIALAVGYESAQALAKAMRRDFDTTPSAVRRGGAPAYENFLQPPTEHRFRPNPEGAIDMQVTRMTALPDGIIALTATARGMVGNTMMRAAQQAYGELFKAVNRVGLRDQVTSYLSVVPDDPKGPDDPHCRFIAGLVFGYSLAASSGRPLQPSGISLSDSMSWQHIASGRYAVFTHIGSYSTLHLTWKSIYRDWLPASDQRLRDAPPMELNLNRPETTPRDALRTEIWLPVA
ncbi:GyrI-like domain-containing protein [Paraburkholderia sp. BR10936]|uniref:GyrI-like domain-containing protein n=1 Tax=Paraburkholderia sp. BR10936 TaxID=3236993 RepID=UPI0034D31E4B